MAGTDRAVGFAQVAGAAYVPHNYPLESLEPGLDETAFYDPPNFAFSNGVHVCEVEVDPETGAAAVVSYHAVDDIGTVINPMIVEGQVHGGLAQGIGQALAERTVYEEGQLLSASFMDYALPRAADLPGFHSETDESQPCTHNPLGAKGCGEAGAIGAPAAVMSALLDALGRSRPRNAGYAAPHLAGHNSQMIQELNPAKLALLYRKQFELCKVKKGETIAAVSDLATRREYLQAAFAAADDLGADIYELCVNSLPSWTKVGVPTIGKAKGTLEAVKAADMVVIFHVPLFTQWLKQVMDGGTRVLMIIDAPDDLERLMAPPGLKDACKHAERLYQATKTVRVRSDSGTDLSYECGEYPVMTQWGFADERGHFDHWGGGHIHTFPNEGSAHGTVVFQPGDIVILPYCRYIADPVRLEIREGHIVKLEGGIDAKLMRDWLDDGKSSAQDRDPYAVSHLGWGLNPQALWYGIALHGDEPERHRAAARTFPGNFLFSTGPNTQGGGKRDTRGHYDVPMRDCTIELDGKVVIDRGRIVDQKMKVNREMR